MMLKKILPAILVVCWMVSPAIAKGPEIPPGKWWCMPRLGEELNLSDEQKNQLDELYLNNRRNLIDLKSAVEKERLELGNLLDKETLDETAVIRQFENLERARTNLATERFRYFLQVRKTIGHDRYQQLKRHFWEFRRERKHRAGERFNRENRWGGGPGREGGGRN